MNLIRCNLDCRHQQDGYCCLDSIAAITSHDRKCGYLQPSVSSKNLSAQTNLNGLTNVANADNLDI